MEITHGICEAFGSLGWTVDMIVDYGSHARGDARVDSDYDVNVYVHRPGWLYLFSEYAQRLASPDDEVAKWHVQIREHFHEYKELSGELEQEASEVVTARTALPFHVTNVFDTRLMLYNMARETWELFSLVHGCGIGNWPIYGEVISFLKRTRPFHRRFIEVHLDYCRIAARQATIALTDMSSEPEDRRLLWLTSALASLRHYVSLFALVQGNWFTAHKDEVLSVIKNWFPDRYEFTQHLYHIKCDPDAHDMFARTGYSYHYLDHCTVDTLHEQCNDFGIQIDVHIKDMLASGVMASQDEAIWLPANLTSYHRLESYRRLVERI